VGSRSVGLALALIFLGYLGLIFVVPPVEDELYYWCWAKDLQWSYYDHPFMTALMIRASTEVFGDTMFAVRFPACVASIVVLGVLAYLTRPRTILIGALLSPLFTYGAVLITPDTPLLMFWSLYLLWLVAVHRRLDRFQPIPVWLWMLGGFTLGCSILGKYTTGLAIPSGLVSFLVLGRMHFRRWMPGYALHIATAFVTTTPILIYNVQHQFEPLLFQWKHSMAQDETPWYQTFGEFIGVQVLLFGTLPFLLLPWCWKHRRELLAQGVTRACVCLYALPMGFFIWKSLRGPIEGNWALASYIGFWPVAAAWWERSATTPFRKWHGRLTFAIPLVCVILLTAHLIHPLPFVPVKDDRIHEMRERYAFAQAAAEEIRKHAGYGPVFAPDYQGVAHLRFQGIDAHQLAGVWRASHFTHGRKERLEDYPQCLFFSWFGLDKEFLQGVEERNRLGPYKFRVRGEESKIYQLWFYQRREPEPAQP
jgi:hypothetical protein